MTPEKDLWILFGIKQMDVFDKDNIAFCSCLVSGEGLRKCMIEVYRAILKHGLATAIEELPHHEKEKLWQRALAVCDGKVLNKEQMIDLSKSLYVIECFQTK